MLLVGRFELGLVGEQDSLEGSEKSLLQVKEFLSMRRSGGDGIIRFIFNF